MVRRLVIVSLAVALIAPLYPTTPTLATVLFSCPGIDSGPPYYRSFAKFSPGLSHTQTAQEAQGVFMSLYDHRCSNGEQFDIHAGSGYGYGSFPATAITSYPERPLGCPVVLGGAGPDYADQTPILQGAIEPFSFYTFWTSDSRYSFGTTKVKQGAAGDQLRFIFSITDGKYTAPAGKVTKMKLTTSLAALPIYPSSCADDASPMEYAQLISAGSTIVQQV
jgi:hypothetical protein